MTRHESLFDRVGAAWTARPGWRYEPSTTPGAAPSWCLVDDGEMELSVSVEGDAMSIYRPDWPAEVAVDGIPALLTWVDQHQGRGD
jgi:hypothetical protein